MNGVFERWRLVKKDRGVEKRVQSQIFGVAEVSKM
jgi:hypothetical protein